MEKAETKVIVGPLLNAHYPSQQELRAMTQRLIDNPSWAFNPYFPKSFLFPTFGTAEWLALAIWSRFAGDASKIPCADKIKAGNPLNWQIVWRDTYAHNSVPSSPSSWIPNTTDYAMKHPEGWVQTLLDSQRFWEIEINAWAMEMVDKEFRETNPNGLHLDTYANFTDIPDSKDKCEHLCRRFHAYQQARYRWHEHLLEKHCERALGKRDKKPQMPLEARACLIGWLSRQRGYARHPLVASFTRRKARPEKKQERYFFDKERCAPSKHHYRVTRTAPARPDEMGWLILSWPVWNFYKWRWTNLGEAVIKRFQFGERDFLPTSRKQLQKALRENSDANNSMPAENALALFCKHLCNPTRKEREMHEDWERDVHIRRGASAFEELARLAIGNGLAKQILPRPRGRGTDEKPSLWDFAQQISA